jgi:hypothetical protein
MKNSPTGISFSLIRPATVVMDSGQPRGDAILGAAGGEGLGAASDIAPLSGLAVLGGSAFDRSRLSAGRAYVTSSTFSLPRLISNFFVSTVRPS